MKKKGLLERQSGSFYHYQIKKTGYQEKLLKTGSSRRNLDLGFNVFPDGTLGDTLLVSIDLGFRTC
ncbi:MAG: hypothetical protein K8R21_14355 [Leptospira sp.]|nr:hypothetical protein [Leptospira sp.]